MKMNKRYEFDVTYKYPDSICQDVKEIIVEHDDIHSDKLAFQYAIMRAFDERKGTSYVSNIHLRNIVREEG